MDNSAAALTQLQQAQQTAINPNAYLDKANQSLGVSDAQNTVTGLRGAINSSTKLLQQVAPSVVGRASNSLVNSAQASRQIANEEAPISSTLNTQGQQYNEANQNLGQLQDKARLQAQGEYQGQQDKLSYLQNLYGTLYQKEQDAKQQAEATRQFNAQLAASRAAASGGSYSLGGGSSAAASPYSATHDTSGGTQFALNGKPITAAQYYAGQGGGIGDVLSFLKSDKRSQAAYNDASSGKYTQAQLVKKYPYIFGGV